MTRPEARPVESKPVESRPAESRPVVVLPDLHGRLDLLQAALDHFPGAHFLSLGDAIDRGPRSLGVVEVLLSLRAQGRATLLMGNHERMAQEGLHWYRQYRGTHDLGDYRRAMEGFQWWMRAGGETVREELERLEFGRLTLEDFPPRLAEYLAELPRVVYVTESGEIHRHEPPEPSVLVSHAAPPVAHEQHRNPLSAALWLRPFEGPFPLPPGVHYSVHGHTPVPFPTRLGRHVYLDLGAYDTGLLAAAELRPGAWPQVTVLAGRGESRRAARYVGFGEALPARRVELLGTRVKGRG